MDVIERLMDELKKEARSSVLSLCEHMLPAGKCYACTKKQLEHVLAKSQEADTQVAALRAENAQLRVENGLLRAQVIRSSTVELLSQERTPK
jgi:hypothetical protein